MAGNATDFKKIRPRRELHHFYSDNTIFATFRLAEKPVEFPRNDIAATVRLAAHRSAEAAKNSAA